MRPLTSDQLGTSGERRFPDLCDGTLIVNKVGEDRTGWDFYVEWPASEKAGLAYDLQPAPLSCHVQVKARWLDSEYIQVSVSSIGRIAKEQKPSFVCVLSYDAWKRAVAARIIPIRGQFLADILRHERLAFIEKKKRNKKTFRFKPDDWGELIDLDDADGFKSFVERHVGPDLAAYMADKKFELDNLGYEAGRLIVRGRFNPASRDEFRSAVLDRTEIQVDVTAVLDTRFGLTTPSLAIPVGPAKVKIDMATASRCTLLVWPDPIGPAVSFEGSWCRLPEFLVDPGYAESVFQSDALTLTAKVPVRDGALELELMDIGLQIDGARVIASLFKPRQWRDFYHVMAISSQKPIRISLVFKGQSVLSGRLIIDPEHGESDLYQRVDHLASITEKMCNIAGVPNITLGVNDFYLQAPALIKFDALWSETFDGTLSFVTEKHDFLKGQDHLPMLYFGTIPLGAHALVYCLEVDFISTVNESDVLWSSTAVRPREITRIDVPTSEVLDSTTVEFLDWMRLSTGIDNYYFDVLPKPLQIQQS